MSRLWSGQTVPGSAWGTCLLLNILLGLHCLPVLLGLGHLLPRVDIDLERGEVREPDVRNLVAMTIRGKLYLAVRLVQVAVPLDRMEVLRQGLEVHRKADALRVDHAIRLDDRDGAGH